MQSALSLWRVDFFDTYAPVNTSRLKQRTGLCYWTLFDALYQGYFQGDIDHITPNSCPTLAGLSI